MSVPDRVVPDPRLHARARWWRGAPPVPRFRQAGRERVAHRDGWTGVLWVLGGLVLFAATEGRLTTWLGWGAGQAMAAGLGGWAVGLGWRCLTSPHSRLAAWKSGALFAFASAGLYAWAFAGGWV